MARHRCRDYRRAGGWLAKNLLERMIWLAICLPIALAATTTWVSS
jgi:hypothetical protein